MNENKYQKYKSHKYLKLQEIQLYDKLINIYKKQRTMFQDQMSIYSDLIFELTEQTKQLEKDITDLNDIILQEK